ncbi:MAG: hypothetical protein DRR19_24660, partial [Candidatus Parabeggiatoa sp. nov. 1]
MKRLFKILLALLGSAIALVLVAILVIVFVIDPNDYKAQITEAVENATGRTLTIEGNIGLTFYPWLGLDLGKVSLGNAPDFEESEFAKINQAQVLVKVIPFLLNKRLEIGTVLLEGAEVTLTRKPNGGTNWEDLAALGGDKKAEDGKEEQPKDTTALEELKIEGLDLRDAKIVWDDQQTGSRYVISDLNFSTSALVLNEPVKLKLDLALDISGATTLSGQINFASQVTVNPETQHYRVEPLHFAAIVQGNKIPGGKQTLFLNTQLIDVDLKQQTLTLGGIVAKVMEATLIGDVQAHHLLQTEPQLTGNIELTDLNLQKVFKQLGVQLPSDDLVKMAALKTQFKASPTKVNLTNLHLSIDDNQLKMSQLQVDLKKQTLNTDALSLQVFGVKLDGQVTVSQFNPPSMTGQLALAPFNPRQVLKRLEQAQLLSTLSLPDPALLPLETAALEVSQFK